MCVLIVVSNALKEGTRLGCRDEGVTIHESKDGDLNRAEKEGNEGQKTEK